MTKELICVGQREVCPNNHNCRDCQTASTLAVNEGRSLDCLQVTRKESNDPRVFKANLIQRNYSDELSVIKGEVRIKFSEIQSTSLCGEGVIPCPMSFNCRDCQTAWNLVRNDAMESGCSQVTKKDSKNPKVLRAVAIQGNYADTLLVEMGRLRIDMA